MLRFQCPVCQKRLKAKESVAGQHLLCPACRAPLQVPGSQTAGHFRREPGSWGTPPPPPLPVLEPLPPAPLEAKIHFACPCGKLFRVGPRHAGKVFGCTACGLRLIVPSAEPEAPEMNTSG